MIIPIETMVTLVHGISVNPLHYQRVDTGTVAQEGMETAMLLQTIDKIGSLMRVGFGEAGAEIIARNLRDQDDDDQDDQDTDLESTGTGGGRVERSGPLNLLGSMNLLGTGRRLFAVFGFCDIRKVRAPFVRSPVVCSHYPPPPPPPLSSSPTPPSACRRR